MIQNMISWLSRLFFIFTSLLAFVGALAYLAIGLTTSGIVLTLGVSVIAVFFYARAFPLGKVSWTLTAPLTLFEKLAALGYFICFLAGIGLLVTSRSDRPLITPWEVIPDSLFLIYGIASLGAIILALKPRPYLNLCITILHYVWSFSIALIVYRIGYGFDPFIHQAAVKAIEELGRIYPTTFYYLGQYSLVTIAHAIFGSTIAFWDKVLIPGLAAVSLPLALFHGLNKTHSRLAVSALILLALPCSVFILTTPQNLAYLFLLIALLWSLGERKTPDLILIWLMSLAAVLTQPIAGLPALIFAASITISPLFPLRYRSLTDWLSGAAYIFILPLALFVFSRSGTGALDLHWPDIQQLFAFIVPTNPTTEAWWLNWIYLYKGGIALLYLAVVVYGISLARAARLKTHFKNYGLPMIALVVSAICAAAINFHFLIEYERSDYPERILMVAGLFSLPFVLLAFNALTEKILRQNRPVKLGWLALAGAAITASLYLSYPRFDHYINNHGYATSKADILAVRWIAEDAGNKDYIVIANQQTSAAALREFGFKKYYQNNLFYYPIPTGGPLYQYYLRMVEKPEQKTMVEAMDLAGVTTAYFVLDDYWYRADRLAAETKLIADATKVISDGQVLVFRFKAH